MKGYTYILECADGSFYTGSTGNIEQRLAQHQNGEGANHTRKRLPVKLVFVEEFSRIDEAFQREKQIQGWSRKKKSALIEGNWEKLKQFAECRKESHCLRLSSTPLGDRRSETGSDVVQRGSDIAQSGNGMPHKVEMIYPLPLAMPPVP